LLAQAIEAEVAEFLAGHADQHDAAGRERLVRNGHLPERTVQTGIGAVTVKAPRVRDRAGQLRFASSILPPYLRRTRTIEELLPWLYLKGISTGGFAEALAALRKAIEAGYGEWELATLDPDLSCIRDDPEFGRLMDTLKRSG
jgi:transposase-like protein